MSASKPSVGVGLIGSGFMGQAHAFAYHAAPVVFDLPCEVVPHRLADQGLEIAEPAAARFGFREASGDWRELLSDPEVQVVAITSPNRLHREMALAAIAAGKHVHCEKPLAPTAAECREMALAAEAAGLVTQVGFNYLKNPLIALARDMIAAGELGEIRSFRGVHAEDYMTDAGQPWTWRLDPAGGGGAFADLGSHVISLARFLVGPIEEVAGHAHTLVAARPGPDGEARRVEVDDVTHASVRFTGGAAGSLEANWMATGQKMQLAFEVYGSKGALTFTQERLNELRLYRGTGPGAQRGFTTILAGPEHPPYGAFCVAPGHQLGFNDLKTIEVRDFLTAVCGGPAAGPDFREGWQVQAVVDAVLASAREGRSLPVAQA